MELNKDVSEKEFITLLSQSSRTFAKIDVKVDASKNIRY